MTTSTKEIPKTGSNMYVAPYQAKENRLVKNSILVDLFSDDVDAEQNDIDLYNALHEEKLPEGTTVQKVKVENVLYLNFKNDISFGLNGKILVLAEHQSTINLNMPLRSLLYVSRIFEQLVPVKERYRKKILPLPTPEFYTFYNGTEPLPAECELKLSSAYIMKTDDPMMDLKVKVININPAAGHEILGRCEVIRQYSEFIETIRKYQTGGDTSSYYHAILECMNNGILTEYLHRKGSEVVNFLQAEYDYEMDLAVQREEAKEEAMEEAMEKAMEKTKAQVQEETVCDIFNILETKGTISNALKDTIKGEKNIEILHQWVVLAATSGTIDEFVHHIMKK